MPCVAPTATGRRRYVGAAPDADAAVVCVCSTEESAPKRVSKAVETVGGGGVTEAPPEVSGMAAARPPSRRPCPETLLPRSSRQPGGSGAWGSCNAVTKLHKIPLECHNGPRCVMSCCLPVHCVLQYLRASSLELAAFTGSLSLSTALSSQRCLILYPRAGRCEVLRDTC